MLGIAAATGQIQPLDSISRKTWLFLVLSGLATGASWLCYFRALKLGDASGVAPIDKLSVVLVALFGVFLLGETLSPRHWAGIAMIASGAVLIAKAWRRAASIARGRWICRRLVVPRKRNGRPRGRAVGCANLRYPF